MNVSSKHLDENVVDGVQEEARAVAKAEKFRMRRQDYSKKRKRPAQFNGMHRRRRKKV